MSIRINAKTFSSHDIQWQEGEWWRRDVYRNLPILQNHGNPRAPLSQHAFATGHLPSAHSLRAVDDDVPRLPGEVHG